MDQPLTQRADQPLRPRGKQRVRSRGKQHVTPRQAPQQTQQTPDQPIAPPDVPVPALRPADAPKADAATAQEKKTQEPKAPHAPDQLNEEKAKQARPEPSAPEPSVDTESEPEPPAEVPIPTQRPDISEPGTQPPAVAPQPPPKPADADDKKMLPDPRSADLPEDKMPAEEVACRERLKTLGVEFEEHKAESNPEIGCSIPYPIMLKTLGKSIAITPGTELNCPMAEAAVRFAADVIQPAAKAEFGADLKSISQASAFVCRPRHGTRKLSEHAFGNALDIASFTLSDGKTIEVGPAPPEKDGKFLDAVRKAACGPFKTVLGPGADADHSLHFHFDLEPRRHGGTFCQ
ncbi:MULTISPECIES: extensin family protein [unclassified Mesorhizobium]|uniref:extensin-like domain-containing protein n=1 Tax=unclassified Mesorhizobium TaxID=325217 RepID=UPI001CC990B3|nr:MULTISPECIES: extensin family protein [unclassified Mesorhizobium]MBZ9742843.1 extensin family protein [Mesorhizobium sp. CO1-1-4]MBZ9805959.1 extensin family protein [Mesorhizobium sp. ES1-6]